MEKMSYGDFTIPKITIGQAVDKYLSGSVKKRFLAAMEHENDRTLDQATKDEPGHLIRSSFIWENTKDGGKYWMDVANDLEENPMLYAPKPGQTYYDFAKKYLSGEVYERFINNCVTFNGQDYLDKVPTSIKEDSDDYFYAPFIWSQSPEGHDYWSKVAENFSKDPKFYLPKEAWVVSSTYKNMILDAFDTKELAERAWGGFEEYTIKKYILAEVQ